MSGNVTGIRRRDLVIAVVIALVANTVGLWLLLRTQAATRDAASSITRAARPSAVFRVASTPPPPPAISTPAPRPRSRPSPSRLLPAPKLASAVSPTTLRLPAFDADRWMNDLVAHESEFGFAAAVLSEDIVDEKPRVVRRRRPEYPMRAELAGIEGWVSLLIVVDVDGNVAEVHVESAEPEGVFEASAVGAALKWRFTPATYRGRVTACRVRTKVTFTLGGGR